jgi:hypothetical protein
MLQTVSLVLAMPFCVVGGRHARQAAKVCGSNARDAISMLRPRGIWRISRGYLPVHINDPLFNAKTLLQIAIAIALVGPQPLFGDISRAEDVKEVLGSRGCTGTSDQTGFRVVFAMGGVLASLGFIH